MEMFPFQIVYDEKTIVIATNISVYYLDKFTFLLSGDQCSAQLLCSAASLMMIERDESLETGLWHRC